MKPTVRQWMYFVLSNRDAPFMRVHHNAPPKLHRVPRLDPHTGIQVGWDHVRVGTDPNIIWKDPTTPGAKRSWDITFDIEHDKWEKWNDL